MARVPADVAAALRELDAEVAALLRTWQQRDWLPSWLGLYRWTKPDGAEHVEVGWYHRYRLRYVVAGVPRSQGRPPRFHAMIGEDAKLDPTVAAFDAADGGGPARQAGRQGIAPGVALAAGA
jgi:hypothetical protein